MTRMNLNTFKNRFRPVMTPSGELERFSWNSDEITKLLPDFVRLVWTVIDADGVQFIVPGYHRVNRLYCVRTREGWKNDDLEVRL